MGRHLGGVRDSGRGVLPTGAERGDEPAREGAGDERSIVRAGAPASDLWCGGILSLSQKE